MNSTLQDKGIQPVEVGCTGWKYYSQGEPSVPLLEGGLQEMPEIRHQSVSASGSGW